MSCQVCYYLIYPGRGALLSQEMATCIFSRKWEITKAFPKNYIQSKRENLWWSVFLTKFLMGTKDLSRGSLTMRWGILKTTCTTGWILILMWHCSLEIKKTLLMRTELCCSLIWMDVKLRRTDTSKNAFFESVIWVKSIWQCVCACVCVHFHCNRLLEQWNTEWFTSKTTQRSHNRNIRLCFMPFFSLKRCEWEKRNIFKAWEVLKNLHI